MSRTDVPQWVTQSFVRSVSAVGATASREEIERICCHLIELWSSPGRSFHNTTHLFDLLGHIDTLAAEAHNVDVVRLAAWGHGLVFSTDGQAIYTRNGGEDRGASAALIRKYLLELAVPEDTVEEIRQLIVHMRKHPLPTPESGIYEPADMNLLVLTDAHLGALANQPQKYKTYMEKVREEYAHVPHTQYLQARLEVVTRLLGRRRIYTTPLAAQWEEAARQNLQLEQQRLLAELEKDAPASAVVEENTGDLAAAPESTVSDAEAAAPSQTVHLGSSLETASDDFEPGSPSRPLTPEEAKQARRDDIARATLEKIERAKEAKDRERARLDEFPTGLVE
ncbi:HD domain-containing protein [Trueperella pyogenes]|uniref:HD domain-containing protein n=1 Tax=Trueperella pyogenes TaxID=1661 RepID=UPI00345CE78C